MTRITPLTTLQMLQRDCSEEPAPLDEAPVEDALVEDAVYTGELEASAVHLAREQDRLAHSWLELGSRAAELARQQADVRSERRWHVGVLALGYGLALFSLRSAPGIAYLLAFLGGAVVLFVRWQAAQATDEEGSNR